MSCEIERGELLSSDGSPIAFDPLYDNQFQMQFDKIPNTMFFLQSVTFPGVSVNPIEHVTPMLNLQEVDTKIAYTPFTINFLVDSSMRNHTEIYQWMKLIIQSTSLSDQHGDAILFINNKKYVRFIDAFPINLGQIQFNASSSQPMPITCSAQFNFDWYEIYSS